MFKQDEDPEARQIVRREDEEGNPIPLPKITDMGSTDMWEHHQKNILKCNRLAHVMGEETNDMDDEQRDAYQK